MYLVSRANKLREVLYMKKYNGSFQYQHMDYSYYRDWAAKK